MAAFKTRALLNSSKTAKTEITNWQGWILLVIGMYFWCVCACGGWGLGMAGAL